MNFSIERKLLHCGENRITYFFATFLSLNQRYNLTKKEKEITKAIYLNQKQKLQKTTWPMTASYCILFYLEEDQKYLSIL